MPGLSRGWVKPFFLEIRGNSLAYRLIGNRELRQPDSETMDRVLGEFVSLAFAPDEEILTFANRWGVVGLCRHGLPATHKMTISKRASFLPMFEYCPIKKRQDWNYEPLDRWRYYARQVRAIISLAYMPSILEPENQDSDDTFGLVVWQSGKMEIRGLHGDEEDWKALFADMWFSYLKFDRVEAARGLISIAIERLLTLTHIRPAFSWRARKPDFHFFGRTDEYRLFENIIMRLILNVSLARGLSVCRECSNSFFIERNHRSANYCPECNKKVQHRQAVRRSYERDKQNPDREKRKKLSSSEREQIGKTIAEAQERGAYDSKLIVRLAEQYGVKKWTIYKIKAGTTGT